MLFHIATTPLTLITAAELHIFFILISIAIENKPVSQVQIKLKNHTPQECG